MENKGQTGSAAVGMNSNCIASLTIHDDLNPSRGQITDSYFYGSMTKCLKGNSWNRSKTLSQKQFKKDKRNTKYFARNFTECDAIRRILFTSDLIPQKIGPSPL